MVDHERTQMICWAVKRGDLRLADISDRDLLIIRETIFRTLRFTGTDRSKTLAVRFDEEYARRCREHKTPLHPIEYEI